MGPSEHTFGPDLPGDAHSRGKVSFFMVDSSHGCSRLSMEREVVAGLIGGCGLLWGVLVGTAAQKDRNPTTPCLEGSRPMWLPFLSPAGPIPGLRNGMGVCLHEELPGRGAFYPGNKQSQVWGLSQTSTPKGKELGLPPPAHRAQVLNLFLLETFRYF